MLEKLSQVASRNNMFPFFKDFDRLNKRRVSGDEGIRALSAAGVPLSASEIARTSNSSAA